MLTMDIYNGRTPLALAVECACSLEIIQMLLKRSPPHICSVSDKNGKVPLHYIGREISPEVVTLLAENNREMLLSPDHEGRLPIHYAMPRRVSPVVVQVMADFRPDSLSVADKDGRLPVHLLRRRTPTDNVQRMMIGLSTPEHLLTTDNEGSLPIHRAIIGGSESGIIKLLVDRCPASLLCFDNAGKLPLHHALAQEYSTRDSGPSQVGSHSLRISNWRVGGPGQVGIASLLAERSPETLAMLDPHGQVILHTLCDYTIPDTVVASMVRLCPEALQMADREGRLVLHYALEKQQPFETVNILLKAFPGAVLVRDGSDRLPLYIACDAGASLDVIYRLARWAPDFLSQLDVENQQQT
jgi:hypothetical protein